MDQAALDAIHEKYTNFNFDASHHFSKREAEIAARREIVARKKAAKDKRLKARKSAQALGADALDEDALRKAAARRKKRTDRKNPWDQPSSGRKKDKGSDADDEEEDEIIDMTAETARRIQGRAAFKNKKVQRDIDRAGARRRQIMLRKRYDEERRRLRSRELREYIRNTYQKRIMRRIEKKAEAAMKANPWEGTHLPSGARYLEHTITPEQVVAKNDSAYQILVDYQMEAVEMFRRWHKPMRWLFHMYAHSDSTLRVQEKSFEEQKESGVTLGPREWQILCRDFDLVPFQSSMDAAGKCFVRGNISVKHEGDSNNASFEEFNAILRRFIEQTKRYSQLPSYSSRVAALMGYLRRMARDFDATDQRGTLKNRRMGDIRVWKSDYVDMTEYQYKVPAHLGYSLSLMHVLELVDELILKIFSKHILTFAPGAWADTVWKAPARKWVPETTEVDITSTLERIYHPSKTHTRNFEIEPLQTGLAKSGFAYG
jgi:hypothetical protein